MTKMKKISVGSVALMVALAGGEAFGLTTTVRNKAEFLDAVASAIDAEGRLTQDLDVAFASDCEAIEVAGEELKSADANRLLDCAGRRIRLDAGNCPCGTVVIGKYASGEWNRANERADSFRGCGRGSLFRNVTFVRVGRLAFDDFEDTLVKDCDFVGCGSVPYGEAGGAISGCEVVEGCAFARCRARFGGALADCGYVRECVFEDCVASDGGGAIVGDTDVSRCEFRSCHCHLDDANDGFGGAIFGGRDIVSCLFVDCFAKRGGAVMTDPRCEDSHVKIVHCTFVRCTGNADEAVCEASARAPVWMLNCLGFACSCWQEGADESDKFSSYQLFDAGFFVDYANGDFHPNPQLSETWVDPCGLAFNDPRCGTVVYGCRDLDGYGYQLSSPWPNCPGCYRFRTSERRSAGTNAKSGRRTVSRKNTARKKKSVLPTSDFRTSVNNRPPHAVSAPLAGKLLDLSKLPCEITQNEILPESENLLDYVSTWYEYDGDIYRFFESRGPLKMPEVGVDPGYGCPGEITPYEEDQELKDFARKYGFKSGWFHRGFPKKGDADYALYQARLECWEKRTNDVLDCTTCAVEKIPFLFSQAPGKGPLPLVVYIAGSGEQGTDLKKIFRQTGLFDAVREPVFLAAHPCHLLAIMPPEFANRHGSVRWSRPYLRQVDDLELVRIYADLIFALQRELVAKGKGTVDPNAIVLSGLGSGTTAAIAMMRKFPGRYAGVAATYPSFFIPSANRYRPGRWWFAVSEAHHACDEKIVRMMDVFKKANADVRLDYYPDGANWWNRQYASPEFGAWLADCFAKGPLKGDKLVVARPVDNRKSPLLAKTGADEATYYGTAEEFPEGLPKEVAGKCVRDLSGIRYLYVAERVRAIPTGMFAHSKELETVHFRLSVSNIASRAFADSPKLNLMIFDQRGPIRIESDAFDGCAERLYGATRGVPVSIGYGVTTCAPGKTNTTVYTTKKVDLKTDALPVDGLFGVHIYSCDDQLDRHLYVENDFLWSEEGEGATALMYLGESGDVFVPEKQGGRPVVSLGRWLLSRRDFEYGLLSIPATVRSTRMMSRSNKIRSVFAAGAIPKFIHVVLAPDTVVYGTTPDEKTGRLVPSPFWKGREVVVPKGTDPRTFIAAQRKMQKEKQ